MRNLGLLLAMGLLLTGAAPCGDGGEGDGDEGGIEGGGSHPGGASCGPSVCDAGEVCCNESCGICTEPGGACTQQFCGEPDDSAGEAGGGATEPSAGAGGESGGGKDPSTAAPRCGGFAGDRCPGAGECVDDPGDDCDPDDGGADCGGLCACSGAAVLCGPNTTFDDDPRVCECVANEDRGGEECGPTKCAEGEVCCNESCGICTAPDGFCTQQACEPTAPPTELCDMSCDAGQHCELVQVTCVRAPCPPQPECVPSPACEGFAGLVCPGEGECIDSPNDDCDPEMGGADCGGYCACTVGPLIDCAADHRFDASPAVCACVKLADPIAGEPCGDNVCAPDEVCCNESCGICTPPDGACIQLFCG